MSDPALTGLEAPAVASEATNPAATTGSTEVDKSVATSDATTDEHQEDQSQATPKTFTQAELDAIVLKEKAKAARAERRNLREMVDVLRPQQQVQTQQAEAVPSRENYSSDEKYIEAMVRHGIAQETSAQRQAQAAEQSRSTNAKTEGLYKEASKLPGFDRDVFEELPLTATMAHALVESDSSAKLMAYLTSNPDEVDRINALSPVKQAAEMGKLEAKVASAPAVKAPKAPAPISTVGNGNTKTVTNLNTSNMDDFKKQFKAAGSRWIR